MSDETERLERLGIQPGYLLHLVQEGVGSIATTEVIDGGVLARRKLARTKTEVTATPAQPEDLTE